MESLFGKPGFRKLDFARSEVLPGLVWGRHPHHWGSEVMGAWLTEANVHGFFVCNEKVRAGAGVIRLGEGSKGSDLVLLSLFKPLPTCNVGLILDMSSCYGHCPIA
jgi:hypothetical protein